jgi:hypothetical protein
MKALFNLKTAMETIHSESQVGNKLDLKYSLEYCQEGNIQDFNICVVKISEDRSRGDGIRKIFREIMAKYSPHLMKSINPMT